MNRNSFLTSALWGFENFSLIRKAIKKEKMCVTLHTNVKAEQRSVRGCSECVRIVQLFVPVIMIITFYFLEVSRVSRFKLEIPQALEEEVTSSGMGGQAQCLKNCEGGVESVADVGPGTNVSVLHPMESSYTWIGNTQYLPR